MKTKSERILDEIVEALESHPDAAFARREALRIIQRELDQQGTRVPDGLAAELGL